MKDNNNGFSLEEWQICLKVLTALKDTPEQNPDNQTFSGLIKKIYTTHKKQKRNLEKQKQLQHDQALNKQSTLATLALNNQTLYRDFKRVDQHSFLQFHKMRHCYSCNQNYQQAHHFYHRLCPDCANLHYQMRFEHVDLSNRHVILTGGRVKVGFATALKFLHCGANVCLTTRFPALALAQFQQQPDYALWKQRLFIYGLDLRNLQHIEDFIAFYQLKFKHLDILIHNAAQTIHYPDDYYAPLVAQEQQLMHQAELQLIQYSHWKANPLPVLAQPQQLSHEAFLQPTALSRFGQPIDQRHKNSWNSGFSEIELQELLEVNLINQIAPYRLTQGLKPCLQQSPFAEKFILNISSSEGIFSYSNKTADHPHTNMTKAALNMLTRTSAQEFAAEKIYMCAVDVGWISTGAIEGLRQKQFDKLQIPPLDCVDGASRILHPIIQGLKGQPFSGVLLKDYKIHPW